MTKILMGLVVLLIALPAYAQEEAASIPPLKNVSADTTGMVAFFYPDDWTAQQDETTLQITSPAGMNISITLQAVNTFGETVDDLPDWLIERQDVPETAFFSPVTYSGFEGWIAQGDGLFEPDVFTAMALVQTTSTHSILIRTDSPADTLGTDAPLITALLQKMVILPGVVTTQVEDLSLNLPLNWNYTEAPPQIYASAIEADLIERVNGRLATPALTIHIETAIQPVNIPLRSQRETLDFIANGQPAQVILQGDATTSELFIIQPNDAVSTRILHAAAADPRLLVDNLSLLQAIFATIRRSE